MSEKGFDMHENETNGNSALDWEIFDILCKDELGLDGLNVSSCEYCFSDASVAERVYSLAMSDKINKLINKNK